MTRSIFAQSVARRTLLAGVGAGVAGMLLRPLQAQEAGAPPIRFLVIHRPCGTHLPDWFPTGDDARNFTLPSILQPLAAFKEQMVILDDVTCPRETSWAGDQHAAGLITMMCGKRFVSIPGTDATGDPNAKNIVAPDKTIDQHLLGLVPGLHGNRLPSIEATAMKASEGGLPSFKVMSYEGNNKARFPEHNAEALFTRVFTDPNAGLTPAQIAARDAQRKSVLDRVNADLARLNGLLPASQKPKLESHLTAIQELETALQGGGVANPAAMCEKPTLAQPGAARPGANEDESTHLTTATNHLNIIKTAFQCDLTRVATFTFAHGNSELRWPMIDQQVTKANGHHSTSHDVNAVPDQSRIDQVYSEQLAKLLTAMQGVQEANGTLLDNTLVVYLNEVSHGNEHTIDRMPVLLIGGKALGLQVGQRLKYGGRYMNDIWAAVCGAFGAPAQFGDAAYTQGPVSGLFT